jgi:hypothetical protein
MRDLFIRFGYEGYSMENETTPLLATTPTTDLKGYCVSTLGVCLEVYVL